MRVETACTLLVFLRMAEASDATLRPMAHDVYPFSLITSYALLTTSLCKADQFSGSLSVPTLGFNSRNRTPATLTPDHTGTENAGWTELFSLRACRCVSHRTAYH